MNLKRFASRYLRLMARYIEHPEALRVKLAGGIPGTFAQFDQPWFRSLNVQSVVDVGANEGQFSHTMRSLAPNALIYAFEPIPDCFNRLKNRFARDKRFILFNCALSDRSGKEVFNIASGDTGASSLLAAGEAQRRFFPQTLQTTAISVDVKTLDEVMANENLPSPLMVKVDVQGLEYQVLKGGVKTLQKADLVLLELSHVQFYEGQKLFNEVCELLREVGFSLADCFNMMTSPNTGEPLQGDFLFARIR